MGGLVFESINDLPPKMRQQVAVKILANVKPKPPSGEQKAVKYRNIKVEANGPPSTRRKNTCAIAPSWMHSGRESSMICASSIISP